MNTSGGLVFSSSHQMDVCNQLHAPAALTMSKEPKVPTEYEVEWAPEFIRTL
jgi:hypothetical protein